MLQTLDASSSRKRGANDISHTSSLPLSPFSSRQRRQSSITAAPLSGLVICLSGLLADEKIRLHGMVERMGGTYNRNLNASTTTHLVTPTPGVGAKYDLAVAVLSESQPSLTTVVNRLAHIVTPQWLIDCEQAGERLPEQDYSVIGANADGGQREEQNRSEIPLSEQLEEILKQGDRQKLFYPCRFLLLGLEEDSRQRVLLEKLIQRGRGTVFWELNETITHLLVMDGCDPLLIDAADVVSTHHPLGPVVISPLWVLESWNAGTLCLLASRHRPVLRQVSEANEKATETKKVVPTYIGKAVGKKRKSSLFRGSLFSLVRLSPPSGALDFDAQTLREDILCNGGQMLSSKVVDALRADQSLRDATTRPRTCYVVFWGGFSKTHISMHTQLSQIQNGDLCTLVLVSPIWLKTCIVDGSIPSSTRRRPLLFQPQPWPILRLHDCGIKLAVSGFVGSERTGLIQLVRAVGATYTEHLKPSNTHLICREPKGPKYEKAIEWKLHVVTVDWLYHVIRYGYYGTKERGIATTTQIGCEAEFSLRQDENTSNLRNVEIRESQETVSDTQFRGSLNSQ